MKNLEFIEEKTSLLCAKIWIRMVSTIEYEYFQVVTYSCLIANITIRK